MIMKEIKTTGITFFTLFLSLGTLLCCVLPLLFVSLGLGAVVATLISQFPILVTLSQHKVWIFIISAILLIVTAWLLWRPSRSCPADPKLAALCERLLRVNKWIFSIAFIIWIVGFVVTYIILPLWVWLES